MFVECEGGSKNGEALMKLGKLMYESHDSCAKNYDCSHPALDQMVQLSNMYGALGARVSQSRYNLFGKFFGRETMTHIFVLTHSYERYLLYDNVHNSAYFFS